MPCAFDQSKRRAARRAKPNAATEELCRLIEAAVAASFSIPCDELQAPTRGAPMTAFARQCAMYLAHVVLGLGPSAVGLLFGRDRTTVAHACRVIEERRDEPAVDNLLHALEALSLDIARGFFARREARS